MSIIKDRKQLKEWIERDRLSYPLHSSPLKDRLFNAGYKLTRLLRMCQYYDGRPYCGMLHLMYRFLYRRKASKAGFDVPSHVEVGPGFAVFHPNGILINSRVKIGENCSIHSGSKIGLKSKDEIPIIGNNVKIGINCTIIGGIKIGDNVIIGAGSVVVKDIPDCAVVAGNPAKVIKVIDGTGESNHF